MKLLLLESVYGLGRPGDQVNVKPGYARNYLIPQRLATMVNADSLRMLGRLKQKAEDEEKAAIASASEMASKIGGVSISIQSRATEEGHLFGSVTEKDIQRALHGIGYEVPVRAVRLEAHIKQAGTHSVDLRFYGEIASVITVEVVPIDGEGNVIVPQEAVGHETPDDGVPNEVPDDAALAHDA